MVAQSCCSLDVTQTLAMSIFKDTYQGIFSKGFPATLDIPGISKERSDFIKSTPAVNRCVNFPDKLQVHVLNRGQLPRVANKYSFSEEEVIALTELTNDFTMDDEEAISFIERDLPDFRRLVSVWDETHLKHMQLTTIGVAIGHANAVRAVAFEGDLGIWIR